ncbi:immune inhibitor A domain-containing protein, partial [Bacillus mycoides]|uniref:immune inhibitor A domain-containing protein n=1 Tax=Bacillus mycoides TaxID=1405 RepID=UPI003CC7CB5B
MHPTKSSLSNSRPNIPPYHYTIQPQHPPLPLFPHHYPHHLPLPHHYHTNYTPNPHPLQSSSLMTPRTSSPKVPPTDP